MYGAYGSNLRLAEPPADMLKRMRPAFTVVDNSQSGTTAFQRQNIFSETSLTTRFIVLQHGINDGQFGHPYEPSLRRMVSHVKAQGRTPIITGLARQAQSVRGRDFNDDVARQVAHDTGSLFADWGAAALEPSEMADLLHPGPIYSERLTARLVSVLDAVAPECAN